jgi:hypothetical protein
MSNGKKDEGDQQQFWQMALETFKSSGLSVRQFCKQEGLAEPSFYIWRKKLVGSNCQLDDQCNGPSAFIEVAMPQNNSVVIELLLISGNTLRIPHGVDAATLSTVLSVAHAADLC